MGTIIRWLIRIVLNLVLCIGAVLLYAKFHDGPLGLIAGGSFSSGQPYIGPEPDWSFVKDTDIVEFELTGDGSSRTTWIMTHNNRIFIPSGYMDTGFGKLWKHWPHKVADAPEALLRVNGNIYPRKLQRLTEGTVLTPVLAELSRKYVNEPIPVAAVTSGSLWIFELLPAPE